MSPEKQRIAIAEACGLHTFGYTPSITGRDALVHVGEGMAPQVVPDYLNDLNAMHEAETALFKARSWYEEAYSHQLTCITGGWRTYRATAAQRAEAFLKTIGKWEGDK